MKSILKGAALLSAAALIASCDSSSGGGSSAAIPAPAPQASVTGSAIKGVIDGATVTVADTAGNVVGTGTVTNGVYDITYDAAQSGGTLTPPLVVTVTGGSSVCDLAAGCVDGAATVPFGQVYNLPADNVIRTIEVAVTNGGTNNTSAATELAVLTAIEAAGGITSVSTSGAAQAIAAVGGLIEQLTGISLGGASITSLGAADINSNGAASASAAQLAISAFNSAILALQQDGETLNEVFARVAALVELNADGSLSGSGTDIAVIANALVTGLQTVGNASGNGAVVNAQDTAGTLADLLEALGDEDFVVLPAIDAGSDAPVTQSKEFIGLLGSVLGDVVESTGAEGFGGSDNVGATEAFAAELDAVAAVTSDNATTALNRLDAALKAAAATVSAADATSTTFTNCLASDADCDEAEDDGLEFVLTLGDDGLTATGVSSRWPLMSTAENNQVTITAATGTADGEGDVSLPAITLTSNEGTSVAQVFNGSYSSATNEDDTNNFDLAGSITTTATGTTSFAITIDIDNLNDDDDEGEYSVSFAFTDAVAPNLTLTFNGDIGGQVQNYTLATESGTVLGTVARPAGSGDDGSSDTITITDGTATLTITLAQGQFTGGTVSVGTGETAVTTGTLGTDGVVTYTDDSIQLLPAIIF